MLVSSSAASFSYSAFGGNGGLGSGDGGRGDVNFRFFLLLLSSLMFQSSFSSLRTCDSGLGFWKSVDFVRVSDLKRKKSTRSKVSLIRNSNPGQDIAELQPVSKGSQLLGLAMVMHKNNEGLAVFEMLNKAQELASNENKATEEINIRILTAQMLVVQGDLEEGLKRFQYLIDQNTPDFRPCLCHASLLAIEAHNYTPFWLYYMFLFMGIIYSLLDKKEEAAQQFETYEAVVPEEFPQRGFLDDITLAAKGTSRVQFQKEFKDQ